MKPSTKKDNNILSEAYNIIYEAAYKHTDGKPPKPMSWWAKRKARNSTWDWGQERWVPRTMPDHGPGEEPTERDKEHALDLEYDREERERQSNAYWGIDESGERGSANGLAHGRTAGPLEEGEGGGRFDGAKDITEVIKRHTEETIQELQQMDAAEGGEPRSDEDYRLSVYEDLNDHLKYLFSDVAYG